MSQRFSDAELAAEFWRATHDESLITEGYHWRNMVGEWKQTERDALYRTETFRQFATLPHAHPENLVKPFTKENE